MITKVIRAPSNRRKYTVQIIQGCQSFRLDYVASLAECRWMAKQFQVALKKHDEEGTMYDVTAKPPES